MEVNDTKPIWIYCAQTEKSHCQKGMAMVVNQPFVSYFSLNGRPLRVANAEKSELLPLQIPSTRTKPPLLKRISALLLLISRVVF